jgi:hypothetical protein
MNSTVRSPRPKRSLRSILLSTRMPGIIRSLVGLASCPGRPGARRVRGRPEPLCRCQGWQELCGHVADYQGIGTKKVVVARFLRNRRLATPAACGRWRQYRTSLARECSMTLTGPNRSAHPSASGLMRTHHHCHSRRSSHALCAALGVARRGYGRGAMVTVIRRQTGVSSGLGSESAGVRAWLGVQCCSPLSWARVGGRNSDPR